MEKHTPTPVSWLRDVNHGEPDDECLMVCIDGDPGSFPVYSQSAVNNYDEVVGALEAAKEMIDFALPKFNWGDSFLDAEAIKLLNDVPIKINKALARAHGDGE